VNFIQTILSHFSINDSITGIFVDTFAPPTTAASEGTAFAQKGKKNYFLIMAE
jgi:hypothetical protein